MNKKTVRDIDLKGKKVFVRCDFNVPMDENKNITDNTRIVEFLNKNKDSFVELTDYEEVTTNEKL